MLASDTKAITSFGTPIILGVELRNITTLTCTDAQD